MLAGVSRHSDVGVYEAELEVNWRGEEKVKLIAEGFAFAAEKAEGEEY